MKLNARTLGIAAMLLVLAAASWWLARLNNRNEVDFTGKQRHDPDLIVEDFHAVVMTSAGRPQYEIRGERMVHFGDDGSSTIEQPYLIQYQPGRAPMHARAREGFVPQDIDYIRMMGDVHVAQGQDPRGAGGDVRAQQMTIKLDHSR